MDKIVKQIELFHQTKLREHLAQLLLTFKTRCPDTGAHAILEELIGGNLNVNTGDKVTPLSLGCTAIMKSGARKGQACGAKVLNGVTCKRHTKVENTSDEKCPAINKGGVNKGQVCGKPVVNGNLYCQKHCITKCKFMCGDKECGRSISPFSPTLSMCRIHLIDELNLDTTKFVLYTNKFGNIEHKYSGLVFTDRKVNGAQHPGGYVIAELTDDDFECIKRYGLPICEHYKEEMINYLNKER